MPSAVVSCPYCNTTAAVPPGARPGQRIPCPRCGESFPYRGPSDEAVIAPPPPVVAPSPESLPRRLSNGRLALLVLGVMLAMALLGLAYALQTQMIRRSYDVSLPKTRAIDVPLFARVALGLYVAGLIGAVVWGWNRGERAAGPRPWTRRLGVPALAVLALIGIGLALIAIQGRPARPGLETDRPTIKAVAPADLAALGYLPDDTDMIAAVHVAEALSVPEGLALLQQVGLSGAGASDLQKWTGLDLHDIDHAALGLKLDADLPTRMVLVVRSRRPINQEQVRVALKAQNKRDLGLRTVYPIVVTTGLDLFQKLNAFLWFANEQTLVIAKEEGLARVPLTPAKGIDHLRPALRQVIKERMGPSAQAWTTAHVDSWDELNFFLRFVLPGKLGQKGGSAVTKLRTLGVWLTIDNGATLRGAFDCADEEGAKALEAYFAPANRAELKDLFVPADAGPMSRALVESLKTTQQGTWVDLQAKASAKAVRGEKAD